MGSMELTQNFINYENFINRTTIININGPLSQGHTASYSV